MIPYRTRLMALPALLAGALAASLLHQPGDRASAYNDSGSAIYAAQVLTPVSTSPLGHGHAPLRAPASPQVAPHPAPLTQRFDVRGAPSVSVALIDQVLASYGSPMAGEGKALYNLGRTYGIDPAFCLAFFIHESAAGTRGEAVLTHNLGNIRSTSGQPGLDGYRYYDSWLAGAEDWYRLIAGLYVRDWKLTSVDQIIPVYAPAGDNNNTLSYVDDVEQLVTAWRAQS